MEAGASDGKGSEGVGMKHEGRRDGVETRFGWPTQDACREMRESVGVGEPDKRWNKVTASIP